jgi:hypothetical protein
MDMLDWNDYRNQIVSRVGEVGKLSPDTVRATWRLAVPGPRQGTLMARSAS